MAIPESVFNADKYQKIDTTNVAFDLPVMATHYWTDSSGNNDLYEVIISNFSIKGDKDYILRVTWKDTKYVSESLQIHYEFINGVLDKNSIRLYSLSKYSKSCMDSSIAISNSDTKYKDCEKSKDDSKLTFKDIKIELGTFTGTEIKKELQNNGRTITSQEVSYPVYSWKPYAPIVTSIINKDFIAIDDVNVSACGTLSTANEHYDLNKSFTTTTDCILITGKNATFDMNGYNINLTGAALGQKGVQAANDSITIRNGNINQFSINVLLSSTGTSYKIYNITISNMSITTNSVQTIGLWVYNSSNNIFSNIQLNVSGNPSAAIEISYASNNNYFYDSRIISSINTYDTWTEINSINNTFLNVTYNLSREQSDTGGQTIRKWYYDANVNNTYGFLQNATVNVTNKTGTNVYSALTNALGSISTSLIEYVNNAGTRTYNTPHNVSVSKTAYFSQSVLVNLTALGGNYQNFFSMIGDVNHFGVCNSTLTNVLVNFTFADETTNLALNAKIDSLVVTWHTATNTTDRTFIYSNSTANESLQLCADSTGAVIVPSLVLKYSNANYWQRTYTVATTYGPTTTEKLLYLLSTTYGAQASFQVQSQAGGGISGTSVQVQRLVGGSWEIINEDLTDSSGIVTFILNTDYQHQITFTKTGFQTSTLTIRPTQPIYTVYLVPSASSASYTNLLEGIRYNVGPTSGFLQPNTTYTFWFNITTTAPSYNLTNYTLRLELVNGTVLNSTTGTNPYGGNLSVTLNTSNYGKIYGKYYVNINGTEILIDPSIWVFRDTTPGENSIWQFITNLKLYNSLDEGDNYTKLWFLFFIMFMLLAAFCYATGMEMSQPGICLFLVLFIVFIFSIAGFFTIDFAPTDGIFGPTMNQYGILLVSIFLCAGYFLGRLRDT